jgi:hypothetical protein
VALRPTVATIAFLCLAIGVAGLLIADKNFTFLAQDSDKMPPAMALDYALKQPWLDFSGRLLLIGLIGIFLFPFSFRFTDASE